MDSRTRGWRLAAAGSCLAGAAGAALAQQSSGGEREQWCYVPHRDVAPPADLLAPMGALTEVEPNDVVGDAQPIPLASNSSVSIDAGLGSLADVDFFAFTLEAGDSLAFFGDESLGVSDVAVHHYDPAGLFVAQTGTTLGRSALPTSSPLLPGPQVFPTRDAWLAFLAPADGTYFVGVELNPFSFFTGLSSGPYTLTAARYRPGAENAGGVQTLFVDFDGHFIDQNDPFAQMGGATFLSPLSAFLSNWGLSPADEGAVIDAVLAEVESNFDELAPLNPDFGYVLLNSRDHADPGMDPQVTRLVVGGTVSQLGISTIGVANSVDPGNQETSEIGFALLDSVSSNDPAELASFNNVPRAAGVSIIDLIGFALGNIVTHEIGHMIGCFHTANTDEGNSVRSVMDGGSAGLVQDLYGVGPDGIFGTADDQDVPFTTDAFGDGNFVSFGTELADVHAAFGLTAAGCSGDLNGSGTVDGADLGLLLQAWDPVGPAASPADLNGDGMVDGADLGLLLQSWGACL